MIHTDLGLIASVSVVRNSDNRASASPCPRHVLLIHQANCHRIKTRRGYLVVRENSRIVSPHGKGTTCGGDSGCAAWAAIQYAFHSLTAERSRKGCPGRKNTIIKLRDNGHED